MKALVRIALLLTSATLVAPALAETDRNSLPTERTDGVVQSWSPLALTIGANRFIVPVKTKSGDVLKIHTDPMSVVGNSYNSESKVVIDTTGRKTGRVVGLSRSQITIALDQGNTEETYFLHREQRRYLSMGDAVVITPYKRVVRAETSGLTSDYFWIKK
ncbi:MAG TPA: hypothetical protein V6D19_12215 [Stenomitos sp.]